MLLVRGDVCVGRRLDLEVVAAIRCLGQGPGFEMHGIRESLSPISICTPPARHASTRRHTTICDIVNWSMDDCVR